MRSPHLWQSSIGIAASDSYTLIKAMPRTSKETRTRAWTDYQFAAIGLALVAFGAAALFAWHVPLPGEPLALYPLRPVSYGTAIGFLLCGIAMVAVVTECVTLARFCAALVTATAAIRLIGYALNRDFSSSLTFVTSGAPANPAIMGPLTALSFVLAACALAVLAAHERRALRLIVGALLASAILTVSLISLFAYLSGNRLVYEWLELGGGEFPIFIAFLALGASAIFFIFFGGAEGAIAARKWLPIPAWFGVFIGTLVLWQALSAHEYREITRTLTGTADAVQAILVSAVRARTDSLRRLEQRLNLYQPTQEQWMGDAYRLLRDYPGTTAIYFAKPSFDVHWAAPADVTSALGYDLESEEESAQALQSALATGGAAMTRFMELSISGRGFNIFVPAYRGGEFAGVIAGVYRAEPFFEAVLADRHPGFSVALSQDGELIYALRERTSRLAAVDQSFAVNDQVWSLRIAPTPETMNQLRSRLPEALLVAGFILATLIALSIYLYQTAEARRQEIEVAHEELQREVSERRLAEQQLEVSRDFYLRLFSEFPNLVWRSDPSGKCDYFNQAWLDYTGRTLAQELGDGWADGVHPDDIEFCLAAYKEASEARRPFAMEYRLRRADGSYGWLYDVGRPYYDIKGAFRGYLGTCYDIDERRRMETALKESASRFRAMAANVPGAMLQLVRRSEGEYVFPYLSKGIANLCGVEAEAIASDAETLFSLMPPEDRQQLTDTLETSAHTLSRFSWNGRIVLADESERWVNLRASPSRLAGGAVMWDGFLFDETEERVGQLEIERSRAQLRALSTHLQTVREEEKANVARELHDELGGKLAALKMGAVWLSGKLTPDQSALLIKTQDLARLADEAVAGVRRMITALRPTVLDDLGLVAAMQWQVTEFRRRFAIECRLTIEAEDIVMDEGTALELFRIFQEALTNVARHAQATRVLASFDDVDDTYVLRVADDGVGIADEQIFTPASHGIRGMMERVQKLKGEISVRGIGGKGTVVNVTIPKAGVAGGKSAAN